MRKWWVMGGSIVVIGLLIVAGFLWEQKSASTPELMMNGKTFSATILRTDEELQRGLSGTSSLPDNHAMLFSFPYTVNSCGIWMKQMSYPIDIIWLNSNKKIVKLKEDARPSSYHNDQDAEIFGKAQNCRYVIETISGTINSTGIKVGDNVQLPEGT